MNNPIDFYFDFISPYSYLAHKKIREIEINKKIKFIYKPILLGGLHNLQHITAPAFIKSKAKFMIKDCKMVAKKFNIKFIFNPFFPINSVNLMRGYLSVGANVKNIYIDNIFDAYWKDGLNLNDEKIISSILKNCKIKKSEFFTPVLLFGEVKNGH